MRTVSSYHPAHRFEKFNGINRIASIAVIMIILFTDDAGRFFSRYML
ncbi:hypothetical protein KNP414_06076 [Paenibacillus mucilaginosus KNP414]|uniref:Uncharacterized protein n=1 Tax=Paenibacillus mucilaginosus (strain KNP414) TaxID=1036673 RepID=F8FGE0_PAEMK|nr:hypothetical protein KNP414_06076 [Paenibacillus mucilaginosus KNP414]